ncbi:hypothetical protein [Nocardioides sp. SYSU D00065]|uniref:hypothetical protein n=1 Tax=Nocardioides sp. SYSU D00065 TaxID=2817378 RepID=UPI001B3389CB|nr:hypothetical protein [Nocardioides sp. SYSU D00065]
MNTTELPVRPDVAAFVARVRDLLADLSEEDRLELTEGLEADLGDQVAEHGGGVLGDPESYARELRSAAGFDPVPRRRLRLVSGVPLAQRLDDVRSWWDTGMARPRLAPLWAVLSALQPAWWVLRAYAAAVALALLWPGWDDYGLTWLPGVHAGLGLAMLVVCVAGSALVGLGRAWPGARPAGSRGALARLVLVALNLGAVVSLPIINGQLDGHAWDRYARGYAEAATYSQSSGVLNRGEEVCNIAAYDAGGRPLTGVQLYDQAGRPLAVHCFDQASRTVPWVLGDVTRWNVFPLAERERRARTPERRADLTGAAFPTPDRATTPAVTHPLVPAPAEAVETPRRDRRERADRAADDGKRAGADDRRR